jgi:hypothetical protein
MTNAQTFIPMSEAASSLLAIAPLIGRAQIQALWTGAARARKRPFSGRGSWT